MVLPNKSVSNIFLVSLMLFVALGTFVFPMFSRGMFLDGLIYGDLSRNVDYSHMWINTLYSYQSEPFIGHPPMMFWLQGLFFKILGDHFWTEHIYSITIFVASLYVINALLKHICHIRDRGAIFLFTTLLLCAPIVPWTLCNNMLENTSLFFTLTATYCILRCLQSGLKFSWIVGGILALVAGFLTKGPVCLFPLAIPVIYMLIHRESSSKAFFTLIWVLLGLLCSAFILSLFQPVRIFFEQYFQEQIMASLQGGRPERATTRWRTVGCLVNNGILFTILGFLLWFFFKSLRNLITKDTLLFVAIALSGSLPLMISMKQACVYIFPVVPYILLAFFPIIFRFYVVNIQRGISTYMLFGLLALGIIVCLFVSQDRQRSTVLHSDSIKINSMVPKGEEVHLGALCSDYNLTSYLSRYKVATGTCDGDQGYIIAVEPKPNCEVLEILSRGKLCYCKEK